MGLKLNLSDFRDYKGIVGVTIGQLQDYTWRDAEGRDMNAPTPSGSNSSNSVTGAQDIYDTDIVDDYSLSNYNPDDLSYNGATGEEEYNPRGFGQSSYSAPYIDSDTSNDWWGDSGASTYNQSVAKMGQPSDMKFSSKRGNTSQDYAGSSGGVIRTTGGNISGNGSNEITGTSGSRYEGLPDMPELSSFETSAFTAPSRDTSRVDALTRQKSAAGLRAMRAQIQKAMGQGYRNPNVKRMTLRDALAGYGQGIESVMSGAQSQAESAYNKEYETEYDTAAKNWQAKNTTAQNNWQAGNSAKLQDWNNKVRDYLGQI